MKKLLLFFILLYSIKGLDANATHGMVTWDNLPNRPLFARVALDSSYHHLRDTPNLNVYVKWSDTSSVISTAYKLSLENKAMRDTAAAIRGAFPSLSGYLKWTDTTSWLGTKYNMAVENKAMKDTAAAIRASMPSLSGYVRFSDTSLNIATRYDIFVQNKAMKDSIAVLRALIPATDTNNRILLYGASGRISNRMRVWGGIITPSTATNQTIDISSAGFSTLLSVSVDLEYNGGLVWNTIVYRSTTQITCNLYRPNTSLVTILGLNVLQGVPFLTANDLSNMRLHVTAIGY